jgi:hypothetical protein
MISWVAIRSIAKAEILAMSRSWLVRLWIAFALLTAILPILIASDTEEFVSEVIGGWLVVYFVPSAILAAIFGTGSMTQELDVAADSILTRALTRYDYVAAKLLSRIGVVLAVHVAATMPTLFLARRFGLDDATTTGLLLSSLVVGSMLIFLVVLGVTSGALTRNLVAGVIVIMVLFAMEGLIFDLLELSFLSPNRVLAELPEAIRGDMSVWRQMRPLLAFGAAAIFLALGAGVTFQRREL